VNAEILSNVLPEGHRSAFDAIASEYDRIFTHSLLGTAQRTLVHEALRRHLREGQRVLDLNCGTGEDAVYLASAGMSVVGCDISGRMINVAREKASCSAHGSKIEFRVCANEDLEALSEDGFFDAALSNFGGLNCVSDLAGVAHKLSHLLRPGGKVFLCVMGRYCAWEMIWYAVHGRWRKAFRRLSRQGTRANILGADFAVHYPSVNEMRRAFAPWFRLQSWRGIGVVLPPSWMESHLRAHPSFVELLTHIDRWFGGVPLFRGFADHILIQLVREEL